MWVYTVCPELSVQKLRIITVAESHSDDRWFNWTVLVMKMKPKSEGCPNVKQYTSFSKPILFTKAHQAAITRPLGITKIGGLSGQSGKREGLQ